MTVRWQTLEHAYGPATNVPELLDELRRSPGDVADVHDALVHQGSLYSATFIAVPILVEIAQAALPAQRTGLLVLLGSVARARVAHRQLEQRLDGAASERFTTAMQIAAKLCDDALREPAVVDDELIWLLCSLSGLRGHLGWATLFDGLAQEEVALECPSCAHDLYVWPRRGSWIAYGADPVSNPDTHGLPVMPLDDTSPSMMFGHELAARVRRHDPELSSLIEAAIGTVTCAACAASFTFLEECERQSS